MIIMRGYEHASTLLTSNRPVDDWGKLLGDTAAVTALLDRLLHHAHVLKRGPRSWRTKVHTDLRTEEPAKWNSTGLGHRRGNGRFCPSTKWAAGASEPALPHSPTHNLSVQCALGNSVGACSSIPCGCTLRTLEEPNGRQTA